jgi:DNA-binding CsgD family transcriptional regulator
MMTDTTMAIGDRLVAPKLTDREIRCLTLVAEGKRPDEAGNVLVLSRQDVEVALTSARIKLNANNLLHAISIAMLIGAIGQSEASYSE